MGRHWGRNLRLIVLIAGEIVALPKAGSLLW